MDHVVVHVSHKVGAHVNLKITLVKEEASLGANVDPNLLFAFNSKSEFVYSQLSPQKTKNLIEIFQ